MKLEQVDSSEWYDCGPLKLQWDWLYDMDWSDPQLENMRVACAPAGGPIATVRDSKKMVLLRGDVRAQPVVRIFNCAGVERSRFTWTGGSIVGFGWTAAEQLLVVDIAGEVSAYSVHGQRVPVEYSLGSVCAEEKLIDCIVYPGGIVGLTFENSIWAITDLNDVRPHRLADLEEGATPRCMAVRISEFHGLEVILACEDSLVAVDSYQAFPHQLEEAAIISKISVSPNNELILVYTEDGKMIVLRSDFQPVITIEPPIDSPPTSIAWCAADFLVLNLEDMIMIFEPEGDYASFSVEGPVFFVAETDCLRVFTQEKHFLLRKVSEAMNFVLSTESDHPSRDLYLARQAYDSSDAKADLILRRMKDDLHEAIHTCIEVAGDQMDVPKQRDLLKAAIYGMAFAAGFPNTKIYETCQNLRILYNIMEPSIGMPMTMYQLRQQTIPVLISRLINGHHHLVASKICESLGMSQDEVLRHWACARISSDGSLTDDEDLKAVIVDKLVGCKGVKYATIAEHAQKYGRMNLARLLLEYEVVAADQVPLLLKLGDDRRALKCAIESGDTDLVYYCIFHLYRKMALTDNLFEFYSTIMVEQQAAALFIKYSKAKNPDAGKEMYRMQGSIEGEATMAFDTALMVSLKIPEDPSDELRVVVGNMREQVVNLLKEASIHYAKSKKYDFQSKICDEYAQLRKLQAHVDQNMGRKALVGLSVADSIRQCLRLNNHKAADDFKKSFGVSDKLFWNLKIQTLAEKGDWTLLEEFASSKKSPVGWEPFIKASITRRAPIDRIEKFIDRLPDSEEKVEYYSSVGLHQAAARTANNIHNTDLLSKIQGMMGTTGQLATRASMMDRLKGPSTSSQY